ncbi:DEAD/DEAH box helicase [Streptomyces albidoflavus]|uniref:DEAD/DEAH box helicase n=1 Tax=Streptomyces albidoflavus TaxID=1886 RepID=UPI002258358B|nr:DEAD/DEAH box helicase [Streptomyces albidoflavus]MCX4468694.1 DEAD/DEAH box helicase [Streptomyces albidoflavus]WSI95980.1 DEAD/DEAH box helicase [Streptomyces albidoflavus]WSI96346.1 DEAD/DEAH box helicase [Streptomyces albidoflavus]
MTDIADAPSLRLDLHRGSTVVLQASQQHSGDLQAIAAWFPSARVKSELVVEVALDDLLLNIAVLAKWTAPNVCWGASLAAMVSEVSQDIAFAQAELERGTTESLSQDEVMHRLGPVWRADLTSFQLRDAGRLLTLRHGANFSVPGAGKTRVALAVFQAERHAGRAQRLLVVCPKSAYESWQFENSAAYGTEALRMVVADGHVDSVADAILINYERLPGMANSLVGWLDNQPAVLVLDEAHRMKLGAAGAYGAACMVLGPHARRRMILTGTPAPNGARDLENLLGFVWPGHGRQIVRREVGGGDLAKASRVLRPLFTRTTKKELGLPPVTSRVCRLKMPNLHGEIYSALIGQMSARAEASRDDLERLGRVLMYLLMAATSPALLAVGTTKYDPLVYRVPPLDIPESAALTELMEDLPSYEMSPKFQEVLKIVDNNAAQGRKTLVWSTFVRNLTTMEALLQRYSPAVVHGGTRDRVQQIEKFRRDPDCYVLLSNPATLGEGVSLHQTCHDAVYVDRDFAAGRYLQSLDRIHRLGLSQDTETNITVLVSEGTIDEAVDGRLADKLQFMGLVLDDPAVRELADLEEEPSVGETLDQKDLQALMGHLHDFPAS